MKKGFSVAMLMLLASTVAFGQLGIGISKGIKGGLNFATVGGSDAPTGTTSNTGFAAGVFAEISLPGPISIQPEVLYSVKGYKLDVPGIGSKTGTYSYVDIPVLAKFSLPLPILKPFIFAGPSFGFLMSAKEKTDNTFLGTSNEVDVKDNTTGTDIGLVIGVGAKLSLIVFDLTVDARYNMGLSTLDKSGNAKVYNRVFAVYVGIEF
ncbi:MAG: porin family protein [Bacteroidota bacterium]|jgi:hypothetical protein